MTEVPAISLPVTVLFVDDNERVAQALRIQLERAGFAVVGRLQTADGLVDSALRLIPSIVVLDLDMPGPSPLEALSSLALRAPHSRVIIFSGHVHAELIDEAFDRGAWAYVSKGDGEDELTDAVRRVSAGEVVMSDEVRRVHERRAR